MCLDMDIGKRYRSPKLTAFEDKCTAILSRVDGKCFITVKYPDYVMDISKEIATETLEDLNTQAIVSKLAIESAVHDIFKKVGEIKSEWYAEMPTYAGFKPIRMEGLNYGELLCSLETLDALTKNNYAALEGLRKGLYSKTVL